MRDSARAVLSAFPKESAESDIDPGRTQARGAVQEIFVNAERMAANSDDDVLWLAERERSRGGDQLCVAPLQVWGPLRDKLLSDKTVVLTSATLMLGGGFDPVAISLGLKPEERVDHSLDLPVDEPDDSGPETLPWRGIDVGSPFDYARQAILYVARHLPPPGRDGLGAAQIDEIVGLVDAAGGRTLGLFSSRRAAEAAAEAARERLPHLTILAQGEAQLPELARLFTEDPATCLFGTLSLWQGIDVPGETCQLVIVDRIPFPRPDDPLMSARQRAVDQAGGNGFMRVAATHAALLLAQGTGRLIRTRNDRGVVAILDPRLVTARYGSYLRASLPPMWSTTDRAVALGALTASRPEGLSDGPVPAAAAWRAPRGVLADSTMLRIAFAAPPCEALRQTTLATDEAHQTDPENSQVSRVTCWPCNAARALSSRSSSPVSCSPVVAYLEHNPDVVAPTTHAVHAPTQAP